MTAPADVWAIQRPDGSFFGDNGEGFVSLWRDEHGARVACIGSEGNRVVRFRLVRADEPEQPAEPPRDDVGELRECVRELADILRGVNVSRSLRQGDADSCRARQCQGIIDRLAAPGQGGAT